MAGGQLIISSEDNTPRMLPLGWSGAHSLSLPLLVYSQAPPLKQKRVQCEEAEGATGSMPCSGEMGTQVG